MSNEVTNTDSNVSPPKLVFVGRYAILDEHRLPATTKRAELVVDKAKLQRITNNNNKRVEDTGDKTPLVIGHTTDEDKEQEQPEVVGFAEKFAVEPFFDTGRTAIYADFYIYETKIQLAREFPRRSVELWASREEIDPISLLGATTPERDLGLMQFNRNTETPYIYSITDTEDMPTEDKEKDDKAAKKDDKKEEKKDEGKKADSENPEDVAMQATVAAIFQSKPMQELINSVNQTKQANDKIMQILDALEQEDAQTQQPAQGQQPPPNSQPPVDQNAAKDNEPPPVKFESSASAPSGSNTSPVSNEQDQYSRKDNKVPEKVIEDTEDFKVRLSRVEDEAKRLKEENAALTVKLEETAIQYRKDSAKALMAQLKTENYVFHDEKSELELMEDLSIEAQKVHYQRIKDNYKQEKKAPASQAVADVMKFGRTGTSGSQNITKDEMLKIAAEAAKNGTSYEDLLEKTYGKK